MRKNNLWITALAFGLSLSAYGQQAEGGISSGMLQEIKQAYKGTPADKAIHNAIAGNDINKLAVNNDSKNNFDTYFSHKVNSKGITNQKSSGRCWLFTGLNVIRAQVIAKYNLPEFELSQNYNFFYDKLEKSNFFMENIIKYAGSDLNDRRVDFLLATPQQDGGDFDPICALIEKYGVVPKTAYPESKASSGSREMDMTLTEKLREDACILRKLHKEGKGLDELRTRKTRMLGEIYRLLCICLGEPPKTFTFEYRDKNNNFHREEGLTPKSFFEKYVGVDLSDYVSLINAPTEDKPYGRSYTVQYLGNVKEGSAVRYLNLPIEELKKAAIAQMKDGQPVWFGCDVGKHSERDSGIMDLDIRGLEDLLDTRFTMTKAERLDYGQSLMTHAMVFQGVNLDENGKPNRWRVENICRK